MKRISFGVVQALMASIIILLGLAAEARAYLLEAANAQTLLSPAFYVATNGSDSYDGLAPTAGGGHGPFATLAKAQSAMRASGTIETTYIRAGTYAPTRVAPASGFPTLTTYLYLTSTDNGETWAYYPPDGVNSAVFNGGSTVACSSSGTTYGFWIDGGENITINGLEFTTFSGAGILIHGGSDYFPNQNGFMFPTSGLPNASGNTIENNIVTNILNVSDQNPGWPPPGCNDPSPGVAASGAIMQLGQATNNKYYHNVVHDVDGMGIRVDCYYNGDSSGLDVEYNALYNTLLNNTDAGAIYDYSWTCPSAGPHIIKYNYIHDYGNPANQTYSSSTHAIYLDDGTSNSTVIGNLMVGAGWAPMFIAHGGTNDVWSGNIIDMVNVAQYGGQGSYVGNYQSSGCNCTNMIGNYLENSIFIANNPSGSGSGLAGGHLFGGPPNSPLNEGNNFGYEYNTGTLSFECSGYSSSDCVHFGTDTTGTNPQFQTCPSNGVDSWSYLLSTSSPVLRAPTSFPVQGNNDLGIAWGKPGFWGPPGYTPPHGGTVPSYGPTC
jgi:hypothetical protein